MSASVLDQIDSLSAPQLRRLLKEHLTRRKLGLYWEANAIERDAALNADIVLPRLCGEDSFQLAAAGSGNLIIEGDNFDSLRLLRATHGGRIRVIYIDPPYNTGNKDWVYNDRYVGANDRWRHSQWLEFLYRRLTLARELMAPDGVILVSINDENRARLELLMDEVFPARRVGSLVWRTKDTGNDLSRRLSHVHEHVLIYANAGFVFNGSPTDRSKFRNPDNDPRGDWSPQPLTANKTLVERPNTYYPIQDPDTGFWYPCDPNRVWAYASEKEIRKRLNNDENAVQSALAGLRSGTIEQLIEKRLIFFPPCEEHEILQYDSKEELLTALINGAGPKLPKKKTPLLRADLPDLDFWLGKPIAPGRPSRKEHWNARPEQERLAPLSSWIAGMNEKNGNGDDEDEDQFVMRSARGGVATDELKAILGSKSFPYPKPLSLIQNLLAQASRPGDTVLDFFAGSGTTGQAVLALNALNAPHEPPRRFILCSSTEATRQEPDKNLCRDVCAARIKKVIQRDYPAAGFAYLRLAKYAPADQRFERQTAEAFHLLTLKLAKVARPLPDDAYAQAGLWLLMQSRIDASTHILMPQITQAALKALAALRQRAAVRIYCRRPQAVRAFLLRHWGETAQVECVSLGRALMHGQRGARRTVHSVRSGIENRAGSALVEGQAAAMPSTATQAAGDAP